MVPVRIGYVIQAGDLSIIPEIGIDVAYNWMEKSKYKSDLREGKSSFKELSDMYHNKISLFGCARVDIAYPISKRLSIHAGPSVKYMLTNILNSSASAAMGAKQQHYAFLLNAGITWHFTKSY